MSELVSSAPTNEPTEQADLSGPPPANRHRLPGERAAVTHPTGLCVSLVECVSNKPSVRYC